MGLITREKHIERFNNVHKTGRYDYTLLPETFNCLEKIPIICNNKNNFDESHGVFWQIPDSHVRWKTTVNIILFWSTFLTLQNYNRRTSGPSCPSVAKSGKANTFVKVRTFFKDSVAVKKNVTKQGVYKITGVAFFDKKHRQLGLSPNGIELHPILSIKSVKQ